MRFLGESFRSSGDFLGVQECRSDASLRSADDSADYEEQKDRMQVCPEDTEGPVNVSRRGGVCPPEHTSIHIH